MRGLTAAAMLLVLSGVANASEKPPANIQKLINQYVQARSDCHSLNETKASKGCDAYQQTMAKLEKLGWCYGPARRNAPNSEYQWLRCRNAKW